MEVLIYREEGENCANVVASEPITIVKAKESLLKIREFKIGVVNYHITIPFEDYCCWDSGVGFIFNRKFYTYIDIEFHPLWFKGLLEDMLDWLNPTYRSLAIPSEDAHFDNLVALSVGEPSEDVERQLEELINRYRKEGYSYVEIRGDFDFSGIYGTVNHLHKVVALYRPEGSKSFLANERLKKRMMELVK